VRNNLGVNQAQGKLAAGRDRYRHSRVRHAHEAIAEVALAVGKSAALDEVRKPPEFPNPAGTVRKPPFGRRSGSGLCPRRRLGRREATRRGAAFSEACGRP
jgi:hypothetical protein